MFWHFIEWCARTSGSPIEYSIINCFLRDAFGVSSCPFWSILFCSVVLGCRYTPLNYLDRVVSGARFLTGGDWVLHCYIAHRRYMAVCCTRSGVTQCTLFGRTSVYLWASSLQNTSQSLCGTILLILYSMVWDWRVLRAGPMLFYWIKQLAPLFLLLFSLTLLSLFRLVLWGWGPRTDRV